MNFKFNITKEYRKMANWHVSYAIKSTNNYLNMSMSEYEIIKNFIYRPKRVLDLGCGLGRMSIFMNAKLQDDSIHYILADTTTVSRKDKPRFGWNHGEDFYNDLSLTEKFARSHGLHNFEIFDVNKQNMEFIKDVDLVMSFLSAGFHYPIENYMNTLLKISVDNCVMIFGVRKNKYSKNSFKEYFEDRQLIENTLVVDGKMTKENILILKGKK